jgi:hypothetical protein
MQNRAVIIIFGLLLASVVLADAGFESSRKLLQYRRYDSTSQQLAANNKAIVNSQYAINAAVESGANPAVTRGAAVYSAVSDTWCIMG